MNLFELFIKIGAKDEASGTISKITSGLGKGLVNAAKIGTAAVGAAATGIAALTKSAVDSYAQYEQLVGGVDTLFKDASQKVQQYAAEAYRTSGMSANEYMENATAFSASLISSLGGDTEKAAEYANRAMVSMSDNANKMGTSLDSIVQTYQSLSRGNMAMLDNLKLGYGGTKEELERLIKDAASYTDIQEQMGITVDASSMSFDNIVNAIAVVQGKLGIAGATAAEAASTIEGSANMMKASWKNLVTGLANENADMEDLIGDFVGSFDTYLDNLLPRFEIALGGVVDLISGLLPAIADRLPRLLAQVAPKLIEGGKNALLALVKGIASNAKEIAKTFKDLAITGIDTLVDMLPDLIEAVTDIAAEVIGAIPEIVSKLISNLPNILTTIISGAFRGIGKAFKALFNPVYELSDEAKKRIQGVFGDSDEFLKVLNDAANKSVDISKLLSQNGRTISEIDDEIGEVEQNITDILKKQFEDQAKLRQADIDNLKSYKEQIRALEQEKLEIYRSKGMAFATILSGDISELSDAEIAQKLGEAQSILGDANNLVEESYQQSIINAQNILKSGAITSDQYDTAIAEAKKYRDEQIEINNQIYAESLRVASQRYNNFNQKDFSYLAYIGNKYGIMADTTGGTIPASEYKKSFLKAFDKIDWAAVETFFNLQSSLLDAGGVIDEQTKETIEMVLTTFEDLPPKANVFAKEYLLNMVDGLTESIPALENAANMSVDEILSVLRSKYFLFEQYGSDVAGKIGYNMLSGIGGALSGIGSVVANALNGQLPSVRPNSNKTVSAYANGLDYVPYDGYVATLHRGERVLTAQEAKSNRTGSTYNISVVVNGADYPDMNKLADVISRKIQKATERTTKVYA